MTLTFVTIDSDTSLPTEATHGADEQDRCRLLRVDNAVHGWPAYGRRIHRYRLRIQSAKGNSFSLIR